MGTIETIQESRRPVKRTFVKVAARKILSAISYSFGILRFFPRRLAKQRSRMVLRELSDDHLEDIGKTRHEAEIEASKPLWR